MRYEILQRSREHLVRDKGNSPGQGLDAARLQRAGSGDGLNFESRTCEEFNDRSAGEKTQMRAIQNA